MSVIKKLNQSNYKMPKKVKAKKLKKLKTVPMTDSSGMGMKPPKVYQMTSLNVEKELKENKVVKESDVFEIPKNKSR
jgi:hypothetical protein